MKLFSSWMGNVIYREGIQLYISINVKTASLRDKMYSVSTIFTENKHFYSLFDATASTIRLQPSMF